MTCCVGVACGRRCILAADSCVVDADGVGWHTSETPKVWAHPDGWAAGFAGTVSLGIQAKNRLALPPPPLRDAELDRWAETEIPGAVSVAIRELEEPLRAGLADDDERPELELLIALRGRLYYYAHLGLVMPIRWHMAIGTGGAVALGSLDETRHLTPRERCLRALKRAEARVIGVRRPWRFVEV